MLCVEIKLFCSGNEHPISSLIRRTLVEVNATDCPSHEIAYLYGKYEPDTIAEIAKAGHTYVLWHDGKIIGCGSVVPDEKYARDRCRVLASRVYRAGVRTEAF